MPLCFYKQEKKKNGKNNGKTNRRTMGTNNLSTHRSGVILRGICGGAALKDKSPQISEDNTVITCGAELSIWDICAISSDAEAFGLQVKFGYDGHTRITFTPKEQPE